MSDTHTLDSHHQEDIAKHVRVYISVFIALGILTIVTVAIGYLELPLVPALAVGLSIAVIKAGLVAAYFMHLITERKVIFAFLILTTVFFLCMIALFMSSFYDQINV